MPLSLARQGPTISGFLSSLPHNHSHAQHAIPMKNFNILTGTVGTNDTSELLERANDLLAAIGFEILKLHALNASLDHLGLLHSPIVIIFAISVVVIVVSS